MNIPDASDLVEDSLRLYDEADVSDADFQAVARQLYDFESHYRSRATFFRLMDVLTRRGYFLVVPVPDHPRYEEEHEPFDSLDPGSVSPILREPGKSWDEETNPVVAYAKADDLHVERGSELFEELVDAEVLTGDEATVPDEISLYAAVAEVCEAADGDLDLVLRWYAALGFHLGMESGEDEDVLLEELQHDSDVARIREIVGGIDDLEMKLAHPSRDEIDVPPPPLREAHPVLKWWFELV